MATENKAESNAETQTTPPAKMAAPAAGAAAAPSEPAAAPAKKRGGRKPGSKNKPKQPPATKSSARDEDMKRSGLLRARITAILNSHGVGVAVKAADISADAEVQKALAGLKTPGVSLSHQLKNLVNNGFLKRMGFRSYALTTKGAGGAAARRDFAAAAKKQAPRSEEKKRASKLLDSVFPKEGSVAISNAKLRDLVETTFSLREKDRGDVPEERVLRAVMMAATARNEAERTQALRDVTIDDYLAILRRLSEPELPAVPVRPTPHFPTHFQQDVETELQRRRRVEEQQRLLKPEESATDLRVDLVKDTGRVRLQVRGMVIEVGVVEK